MQRRNGPRSWPSVTFGEGSQAPNPQGLYGANLLARWRHEFGNGDALLVQAEAGTSTSSMRASSVADFQSEVARVAQVGYRGPVSEAWRVQAGYSHLQTRPRVLRDRIDLQQPANIGSDPRSWWNLRATHALGGGAEVDVLARRHGTLANRAVLGYTAADLRVGWRTPARDVSLLVQNLFDPRHVEWAPAAAQLRLTAFLKAALCF